MLLGPLTFKAGLLKLKIMLQQLGVSNSNGASRYHSCLAGLETLITSNSIHCRCYFEEGKKIISIQLHGFSDASQAACAGAEFLKTVYEETSISVALPI